MKYCATFILLMLLSSCGSVYHLRTGGWKLSKVGNEGTCLVVHAPEDPEVVRVCIATPEKLKISKTVAEELCRGAK